MHSKGIIFSSSDNHLHPVHMSVGKKDMNKSSAKLIFEYVREAPEVQ